MTERLVEWFMSVFGALPKELILTLISALPILELRGGLIAAALMGVNWVRALFFCLIGNILPIPFLLLLITPVFNRLKKTKHIRPLVEKLEAHAMGKSEKVQKYQFWGLLILVGIPLPGTGGWTGALVASVLGMDWKKALPPIILGIFLAAFLMILISYVVPWAVRTLF